MTSEQLPVPAGEHRELADDRARFEGLVFEQLQRASGCFAVLAIDLDGLKDINDSKGHLAGNILLDATEGIISSSIRKKRGDDLGSFVAEGIADHPHGDEFWALLLNVSTQEEVDLVIARLRAKLAEVKIEEIGIDGIQASIGGLVHKPMNAVEGQESVDTEGLTEEEIREREAQLRIEVKELLKAADDRMYDDKMQRAYAPVDQLPESDKAEFFEDYDGVLMHLTSMQRRLGGAALQDEWMSLRALDKLIRAIEWKRAKEAAERARQQDLSPGEPPQE